LLNVRTDGMRKGQFRKHLKERRCVIPCEGFYEWRDEGGKQPYYFSRKDGKPLMLWRASGRLPSTKATAASPLPS
jgi:putative SOS response-associated peptidase YedK